VISLLTGLITRAFRWLYCRQEVIVFRAAPLLIESVNSHAKVEVIPIKQGVRDEDLPPMAPDVARELLRRISWRSRNNDVCYLLLIDGCGVGYGWIRSAGKIMIEEIGLSLVLDASQICFFDFYIDPSVRGRGLYTNLLRDLRKRFKSVSTLIYAESWNVASLSGISAAGFTPLVSVHGVCMLGKRFPTAMHMQPNFSPETREPQKHATMENE
jgi:hypothetical protein